MSFRDRLHARAARRSPGRVVAHRREQRMFALIDAALPALRLLAHDDPRALDPAWVFLVSAQADVDVEHAPPEIVAAMRGLCPEEPVVAMMPVQRLVDELTPEAAQSARVLAFFERAREPAGDDELRIIVFHEGRYELVRAVIEPLLAIGEA